MPKTQRNSSRAGAQKYCHGTLSDWIKALSLATREAGEDALESVCELLQNRSAEFSPTWNVDIVDDVPENAVDDHGVPIERKRFEILQRIWVDAQFWKLVSQEGCTPDLIAEWLEAKYKLFGFPKFGPGVWREMVVSPELRRKLFPLLNDPDELQGQQPERFLLVHFAAWEMDGGSIPDGLANEFRRLLGGSKLQQILEEHVSNPGRDLRHLLASQDLSKELLQWLKRACSGFMRSINHCLRNPLNSIPCERSVRKGRPYDVSRILEIEALVSRFKENPELSHQTDAQLARIYVRRRAESLSNIEDKYDTARKLARYREGLESIRFWQKRSNNGRLIGLNPGRRPGVQRG